MSNKARRGNLTPTQYIHMETKLIYLFYVMVWIYYKLHIISCLISWALLEFISGCLALSHKPSLTPSLLNFLYEKSMESRNFKDWSFGRDFTKAVKTKVETVWKLMCSRISEHTTYFSAQLELPYKQWPKNPQVAKLLRLLHMLAL